MAVWLTALQIVFNWLNARQDYALYRKWAKLSGEMPGKQNSRVPGISRAENEKFWQSEDQFTYRCSRAIYFSLFGFSFVYSAMLFMTDSQTDLCTYLLLQAINIAHFTFLVFKFLPSIYLTSLFFLNLMRFFVKRFRFIARKIKRLNAKIEPVPNRKLTRLLYDHNRVHLDLIEMNRFFRCFVGFSFLCLCAVGTMVSFILINEKIDWKGRALIFTGTFVLYIMTILIPFQFASFVTTEVTLDFELFDSELIKIDLNNLVLLSRSIELEASSRRSPLSDRSVSRTD